MLVNMGNAHIVFVVKDLEKQNLGTQSDVDATANSKI